MERTCKCGNFLYSETESGINFGDVGVIPSRYDIKRGRLICNVCHADHIYKFRDRTPAVFNGNLIGTEIRGGC